MKTKFKFGRACYWSGWVIPAVAWLGLILALMFVGGCTSIHAGVGMHSTTLDGSEIGLENPIGNIGGEKVWFKDSELRLSTTFDHYSGMLQQETGGGFNVVSVRATIDLTNR